MKLHIKLLSVILAPFRPEQDNKALPKGYNKDNTRLLQCGGVENINIMIAGLNALLTNLHFNHATA